MVKSRFFPLDNVGVGRKVPIMIREKAQFDGSPGTPELHKRQKRQAK